MQLSATLGKIEHKKHTKYGDTYVMRKTSLLLSLILGLVAVNLLDYEFDLTESGRYTIDREILSFIRSQDSKIVIRCYISDHDNELPAGLRNYAVRIRSMLARLEEKSDDKIKVKFFDPLINSEAEETARIDGLEKVQLSPDVSAYFGLTVESQGNREAIKFLDPQREHFFLYDIARRISKVADNDRKVIGVYSSFEILGGDNSPKWAIMELLEQNHTVVDLRFQEDQSDVDLLLIIHPNPRDERLEEFTRKHLAEEKSVILLFDPHSIVAEYYKGLGLNALASSTIPEYLANSSNLLSNDGEIVFDKYYQTSLDRGSGPEDMPTVLTLDHLAINQEHSTSSGFDFLTFLTAGQIDPSDTEQDESSIQPLVFSSEESFTVDIEQIGNHTRAEIERIASGTSAEGNSRSIASISSSNEKSKFIMVADVDWIFDEFAVRRTIDDELVFINSNFPFFLNLVDYCVSSNTFINIRSVASEKRPLTKLLDLDRSIELDYETELVAINQELISIENQLNQLLESLPKQDDNGMRDAIQKKISQLQDRYESRALSERHIVMELNREKKFHRSLIKWTNIAGLPMATLGIGFLVITFREYRAQ